MHECSDFLDVLRYSAVESLCQHCSDVVAVTKSKSARLARSASSPGERQRPSRMSHTNGGIKSAAVANDVEEVNQYDLEKLGFQALEESSGGDVMNSPYERWISQAFGAISRTAEQGAGISTVWYHSYIVT